jgi:hypothetical protein
MLIAFCEAKLLTWHTLHSYSAPFADDSPDAPATRGEIGEALGASDSGGCSQSCRVTVKQEIVSKAACANPVANAPPGLIEAGTASVRDPAEEQRQREQEEWEAAMRVMAEEKLAESRQEELRLSLLQQSSSGGRVEDADAAVESAVPALAEHTAELNSRPAIAQAPAATAAGVCAGADLGDRLDACALESMSKKELVAYIHAMAAPDVLQAYGLSGSPSNVAKKTAKEKVCCDVMPLYRTRAMKPPRCRARLRCMPWQSRTCMAAL